MYLYLGQNTVVRQRDVVAICDIENTTTSRFTRAFLADAEKGRRVINVAEAFLPKSFVVTAEADGTETVYISPISPATLRRRVGKL